MKTRLWVLSCLVSSGLVVTACGGDAADDLFGPGVATGGAAGTGPKAGSGGVGVSGSGGASAAGTGGKGGVAGSASTPGKAGASGQGEAGTGGAGEGGTEAGGKGGAAGVAGKAGAAGGGGKGGGGKAGAGGKAGGAGKGGFAGTTDGGSAGEGGSASAGDAGAAGEGGEAGAAGEGGAGGGAGEGGAGGGAGEGGAAGSAGGPTIEIIGKRNDKEAREFWVLANDLVWLGLPANNGGRTPFRAPRAGGNGGRLSAAILGTQEALVPDTNNPAVFYDGEVAGQSGIGRYLFGGSVGLAAVTPNLVTHLGSSTNHLCWAETTNNGYRIVCRTRTEAARIIAPDLYPNVSSLASTNAWVYFTSGNTLLRWDRTAAKPATVADDIGRVKAIGNVIWAVGGGGHVVRVADGDSTIDYGAAFSAAGAVGVTTGVTDKYLYVGLSYADPTKTNEIIRVNENEGEVETVVPNACAAPVSSVGSMDKYVYFLCEDDNIYRAALP